MSQVTRKPSQPATEGIPGKRFRPFRRTRKVIGAIALTALGITLASTAANAVLEQQERSSTAQYGHLVEVAGGALNVVRAGTKGGQPPGPTQRLFHGSSGAGLLPFDQGTRCLRRDRRRGLRIRLQRHERT